jgi:hypothetical protein
LPFYYHQEDSTDFVTGEKYFLFLRKYEGSYHAVGRHQRIYLIHDDKFIFKSSEKKSIQTFIELIKATIGN